MPGSQFSFRPPYYVYYVTTLLRRSVVILISHRSSAFVLRSMTTRAHPEFPPFSPIVLFFCYNEPLRSRVFRALFQLLGIREPIRDIRSCSIADYLTRTFSHVLNAPYSPLLNHEICVSRCRTTLLPRRRSRQMYPYIITAVNSTFVPMLSFRKGRPEYFEGGAQAGSVDRRGRFRPDIALADRKWRQQFSRGRDESTGPLVDR